ncbi:glycoside hydrolase family 3 N-terminal domain-containing protein [Labilibacter marinus]|uniref:glycoside hydrolase family 3 N-terminal domain-containing protein n=1 Tax=Labilibacter marinus TaxID=1477105 RepID=UPI000836C8FE|nr:glycoside hydrolase family 3 N-terminal domain-containing protein [Labilibacter marinus]
MKNKILITSLVIIIVMGAFKSELKYKDSSLSPEERAYDLIKHMTLEEKIAQMTCVWEENAQELLDSKGQWDANKAKQNFPNSIGQLGRPSKLKNKLTAKEMVEYTNTIQKYFIEETRLGIPVIFHEESLHGHAALEGTSFPQPIALGGTFDPELIEKLYGMSASEIRARGGHLALTPVVDVAREPRWGRVEETFGEDPYLVSEMGVAAVKGFQGDASFKNKDKVMATLKHFAAHGQPESGTNCGPVNVSERVLREVFFPPFKRCIEEANAMNVMASYNEIDAVPSHASAWLLNDVLRKEWGFKGVVVSDYYAVSELYQKVEDWGNWVAGSPSEAAALAVNAGVNIELPKPDCYPYLVEMVQKGKVKESRINELVLPLLIQKFKMGLFEDPYVNADKAHEVVNRKAHRELALEAALKSITLLENRNNTLPLEIKKYKSIAVIGPNADRSLLGGYSGWPQFDVSLLEGIKNTVGDKVDVLYAEGCKITTTSGIDEQGNKMASADGWNTAKVGLPTKEQDDALIEEAIETAKKADIIVLAIGGNEQTSREAWAYNHMGDRTSLDLFGRQQELFDRLKALGKKVVVVLNNGRPLSVNKVSEEADALLECWYLGQESGTAITQVLFGEYNPGGKLPISIPRSVGHIPCYYNYKPFDRRGYLNDEISPLYSFGYGLSYASFEMSTPVLSKSTLVNGENIAVQVEVTNTSNIKGDEVIQLYIRDMVSSVTRPIKELKAFKRITLEAKEKKTVEFQLTSKDFAFWNINKEFVAEPGDFKIMIGNSSADVKEVKLEIK